METIKNRTERARRPERSRRTCDGGHEVKNELLLALPDREYAHLRPHLEYIELPHHTILHEPGQRIEFAHFLNSGMASLVILTSDGRSVEVAIVGKEGMVGTPLAVGLDRGPYRAVVQITGTGCRIKSDLLIEALQRAPELRLILNRYVLIQGLQLAQIAACNRLHEIEQRLARWLLMCQDRVESDILLVTHDFLAQMLGTGRPSVSLAAGILQRSGMIENLRGRVRIKNRKDLENAACECYRALKQFNGNLGIC
ncbi:MAG TPA: Crp/Fnr family transcriptional regulator [Terriglobales bacterium]|nr:Crp/Fnr family transcriptional regulator [Terriglobales bacterium]